MRRGLAIAIAAIAISGSAHAQALLRSGGANGAFGQAWLFTRNGSCHALTPAHAVEGATEVDLMLVGQRTTGYARARVVNRWMDLDLALLSVNEGGLPHCGPHLALPLVLDKPLAFGALGEVRRVDASGTLIYQAVRVAELYDSELAARGTTAPLMRTFSGSVLYVADAPIGILTDVSTTLMGTFLRMDIGTRVALDFLTSKPGNAAHAAPSAPDLSCNPTSAAPDDVAAASSGGRVVAWEGVSQEPSKGPANLIDGCGGWSVWRPAERVSVTIELGGVDAPRIRQVVIDATGVPPADRPAAFEVFVRANATGSWRPVGAASIPAASSHATIALSSVLARQVKLSFQTGRDAQRFALRAIRVLR